MILPTNVYLNTWISNRGISDIGLIVIWGDITNNSAVIDIDSTIWSTICSSFVNTDLRIAIFKKVNECISKTIILINKSIRIHKTSVIRIISYYYPRRFTCWIRISNAVWLRISNTVLLRILIDDLTGSFIFIPNLYCICSRKNTICDTNNIILPITRSWKFIII